MKALSASTRLTDPYRAGLTLGKALAVIEPEVVFLFSTVQYRDPGELLEGLYDGLPGDPAVLIGCSGDGCLERDSNGEWGAAALALSSSGDVKWAMGRAEGVGSDPELATQRALASLNTQLGGEPTLAFIVSDFRTDASIIERVLRDEARFPVVGGLAGDDNRMQACFQFADQEVLQDSVLILGARGPLRFDIHIGNALTPVGRPGRVDQAEGTQLMAVDGIPAGAFIERETGKPVLLTDRGVVALTVIDGNAPERKRLRSIVPEQELSRDSLNLYGSISAGEKVQVCLARPEELLGEVNRIAQQVGSSSFKPEAALIISCTGRKWLLGEEIHREVQTLAASCDPSLAIAGFPSFGEFGPLRENNAYGPNLFHNMTYVLLLLAS